MEKRLPTSIPRLRSVGHSPGLCGTRPVDRSDRLCYTVEGWLRQEPDDTALGAVREAVSGLSAG
jgi:hypothetical protein